MALSLLVMGWRQILRNSGRPTGFVALVTAAVLVLVLTDRSPSMRSASAPPTQSPAAGPIERPAGPTETAADFAYGIQAVDERPVLLESEPLGYAVSALSSTPAADPDAPVGAILHFQIDAAGGIDPASMGITPPEAVDSVASVRDRLNEVRFRPAQRNGRPVRTAVALPIRWSNGIAVPLLRQATWNPGVDTLPTITTAPASTEPAEPVEIEETGVKPEVINLRAVQTALERLYPREYADARVGGQVMVKFMIGKDGRVEPGSILVLSATHDEFAAAAAAAVGIMRFKPIIYRGSHVRVWAIIPIGFEPPGP